MEMCSEKVIHPYDVIEHLVESEIFLREWRRFAIALGVPTVLKVEIEQKANQGLSFNEILYNVFAAAQAYNERGVTIRKVKSVLQQMKILDLYQNLKIHDDDVIIHTSAKIQILNETKSNQTSIQDLGYEKILGSIHSQILRNLQQMNPTCLSKGSRKSGLAAVKLACILNNTEASSIEWSFYASSERNVQLLKDSGFTVDIVNDLNSFEELEITLECFKRKIQRRTPKPDVCLVLVLFPAENLNSFLQNENAFVQWSKLYYKFAVNPDTERREGPSIKFVVCENCNYVVDVGNLIKQSEKKDFTISFSSVVGC